MNESIKDLRLLTVLIATSLFVACGGGGGGTEEEVPVEEVPLVTEPVVDSLSFDNGSVDIGWAHALDGVEDTSVTFTLYVASEKIEQDSDETGDEDLSLEDLQDRFGALAGASTFDLVESPFTVPGLTNDTTYYLVLTATTDEGTSDPSDEVRATPRDYSALPAPAGSVILNDTGFTNCGDYAFAIDVNQDGDFGDAEDILNSGQHNNDIDCASPSDADDDTIPAVAAQDGANGRDATSPSDADGLAGFSFTKLSAAGADLAATATDWSCVRDDVTGLVWEVKAEDGLHSSTDLYTWFSEDTLSNGGFEGYARATDADSEEENNTCSGYSDGDESTYCNTEAFVERVNAAGLCGASDWRLPTRQELVSLVHYGLTNDDSGPNPIQLPSLDTEYFPNTRVTIAVDQTVRYWSDSAYSVNPVATWGVYFGAGGSATLSKGQPNAIRLVREP